MMKSYFAIHTAGTFKTNMLALTTSTRPHTHYFQSEKAAKHELLTCDAKFFFRQWIGHGRLTPQVRHKRSVLFAIYWADGGENSIFQRLYVQSEECEQKTGFCATLKKDKLTDGKVD
jgi:hypothetical protein